MTENAFTVTETTSTELADRATWAINSLLEAGQDALAADLAATYDAELQTQRKAS